MHDAPSLTSEANAANTSATPSPKPARKERQPAQLPYLQRLMQRRTPVLVYLLNGQRLRGVLGGFDDNTLLLDQLLVYKHTITTVVPDGTGDRPRGRAAWR